MEFKREGGLRLCECLHPLGYHAARPAWFFHEGSSALAKAAPTLLRCAFCDCTERRESANQELRFFEKE
jgi:hypothetical protein